MNYKIIIYTFIGFILFSCFVLAIHTFKRPKEGFLDTIPIKYIDEPDNTKLPYGYYKINENSMALIPYGYMVHPTDPAQIIPSTSTGISKMTPIPIPPTGLVNGYYKVDASNMSILPPNMKPNVKSLTYFGGQNIGVSPNAPVVPFLTINFDYGYVSEQYYYEKTFTPVSNIQNLASGTYFSDSGLPDKTYYVDTNKTISFLPYGQIADPSNSTGYIPNPDLISSTGLFDASSNTVLYNSLKFNNANYRDVSNNYDVVFHDSIDDMAKQNNLYNTQYDYIKVKGPDGNLVVLPSTAVQGTTLYYEPGKYIYGSASYVPTYEDSVFLSRRSQLPTNNPYETVKDQAGFCEQNKNYTYTLEQNCNSLGGNTCASTSCCVLLGGTKCVAGDEKGPSIKTNYSDPFIKNKDFYYYRGKCYGNCPYYG